MMLTRHRIFCVFVVVMSRNHRWVEKNFEFGGTKTCSDCVKHRGTVNTVSGCSGGMAYRLSTTPKFEFSY